MEEAPAPELKKIKNVSAKGIESVKMMGGLVVVLSSQGVLSIKEIVNPSSN